ncbi:MAG: hypothetical protein VW339_01900, partial [Quisquiliibacterium sp.]
MKTARPFLPRQFKSALAIHGSLLALMAAGALAPSANAQESASGLGQVVVTASRLPVTDSGLAQSVTIID